jgi:ABC-type glycerol-3-phosphate transport system permease component
MTAAAETTPRPIVRPVSRSRRLRKSRFGRTLFRSPFYLLIAVILVYCLFPFYWAVRSSFTPVGDLFSHPIQ